MLSQREVAGRPSGRHRAEESALRKRILRLGVELRLRARSRPFGERAGHLSRATPRDDITQVKTPDRRRAKWWNRARVPVISALPGRSGRFSKPRLYGGLREKETTEAVEILQNKLQRDVSAPKVRPARRPRREGEP